MNLFLRPFDLLWRSQSSVFEEKETFSFPILSDFCLFIKMGNQIVKIIFIAEQV